MQVLSLDIRSKGLINSFPFLPLSLLNVIVLYYSGAFTMLFFRRAFERLDSQEGERMCTIPKIISTGVLRKNGLQIKGIPGQVMTSTLK